MYFFQKKKQKTTDDGLCARICSSEILSLPTNFSSIMYKNYLLIGVLFFANFVFAQQKTSLPNEYQIANYNPIIPTNPHFWEHLQELNGSIQKLELAEYLPSWQDSLVVNGLLKDSPNNVQYTFNKDKTIATYQFAPRANNLHTYYYRDFKRNRLDSLKMLGTGGRQLSLQHFLFDPVSGLASARQTTMLNETREVKYPISQDGNKVVHEMDDQLFVYQNKQLVQHENTQRQFKSTYEYHPNGKLKQMAFFQNNTKMREEFRNQSEQVIISEQYNYSVEGALLEISRDSNVFDQTGRLIQLYRWNATGQNDQDGAGPAVFNYEYKKGRLTLTYKTIGGQKIIQSQYFYNERGELVKQIGKQGETTWEYTNHDEAGNWTRRVIFTNGEPQGVHTRKITYYEKK